jgi:hypothetical protein
VVASPAEGTSGGLQNNYHCVFQDTAAFRNAVDALPGVLLAENNWQLAQHDPPV